MTRNTTHILADLVTRISCKPGWAFGLHKDEETGGTAFVIYVMDGWDSSQPNNLRPKAISHWHPVPLTTFNEASWLRWIFEKCRGVENHELGEWFRVVKLPSKEDPTRSVSRPFAPLHGPGEDPYVVHDYRNIEDQLITQDGSRREPYDE